MLRSIIDRIKPKVVKKKVSLEYEITKYLISYKQPIMFENIASQQGARLIGNLWNRTRIAEALRTTNELLIQKMLCAIEKPQGCKVLKKAPVLANCISKNLNLHELPIPKWYPKDGGRYITGGIIIAQYDGKINASFHRLMLIDNEKFAVRLVPRHLYKMYKDALASNTDLKVCIVISVYPDVLLAAGMPVSYETNELEVASALRANTFAKPLEIIIIENLPVPVDAEYVLVGRITAEQYEEGPFVDITGTYDKARMQPVIKIEKLFFRTNPIFHAILPAGYEHYAFMGLPREPFIYKNVSNVASVRGVRLTEGGCCWLHGVMSIEKTREGDAKNAILAAFAAHPSMKKVVVVDSDVDIFDDRAVEWALATRFQASTDMVIIENVTGSSLDPSAHTDDLTTKIGLDATKPLKRRAVFEKATL